MVLLFKRQEETNYTEVCKTKTIKCNSVAGVENKSTTKNKMCTKHVGQCVVVKYNMNRSVKRYFGEVRIRAVRE